MYRLVEDFILKEEMESLEGITELNSKIFRYSIMYMARIHSQAEFLLKKVYFLRGSVYSTYEASEIFEAFTVKTICDWEWYCEKLIYEQLSEDTSMLSRELGLNLPQKISFDECVVYLNGLGYFDIKNVQNLKSIAKKILIDSKNCFKAIEGDSKKFINDFYILRNFVAHKSHKAKGALMRLYSRYNQKNFVEVGEFLTSKKKLGSDVIIYQEITSSFWLAAFQLMSYSCPKVYGWIGGKEKVYNDDCHRRFMYLVKLYMGDPY